MKPRYLFIDDEVGQPTKALLDGFNDTSLVSVESLSIAKGDTFDSINDKLQSEYARHGFDGILLDLCLDGTGANSLKFKAPPVAQQVRTLASENILSYLPIVLCSTIENEILFQNDSSSHNLFDYYFNKADLDFRKEAQRLQSLAEGYQTLNKNDVTIGEVLGRTDVDVLDSKLFDFIPGNMKSSFDVAQRIIKDMFHYSGLLVTERIVAARLGVDIEKSGEAWKKLKDNVLVHTEYKGVFYSGWHRYWADKLNSVFMEFSGGEPYQIMTAAERVAVLTRSGFNGLVTAEPITYNQSTYYNTVCVFYKRPMDAVEGIPVEDSMKLKPWQENRYVSFLALAKGEFKEECIGMAGKKRMEEIKQRIQDEQAKGE